MSTVAEPETDVNLTPQMLEELRSVMPCDTWVLKGARMLAADARSEKQVRGLGAVRCEKAATHVLRAMSCTCGEFDGGVWLVCEDHEAGFTLDFKCMVCRKPVVRASERL